MLVYNNIFPKLINYEGYGSFKVNDTQVEVEASFKLIYFPNDIIIYSTDRAFLKLESVGFVSLHGELINGRQIECKKILINNLSKSSGIMGETIEIGMTPFEEIILGKTNQKYATQARFYLFNYSFGKIKCEWKNKKISIDSVENYENTRFLSKSWNVPLESAQLVVESEVEEEHQQFILLAETICKLLSLAICENTIFDRTEFLNDANSDEYEVEVWKERIKEGFGDGAIVSLPKDIEQFIPKALDVWFGWSDSFQKDFYTIVRLLNTSNKGFVDDRMLRVEQAWEITSTAFSSSPSKLPVHIEELKKSLFLVYENWKTKYPQSDANGLLKNRISDALNWEKLINKLRNFSDIQMLNIDKINLKFEELVLQRNGVAHTGRLKHTNQPHLTLLSAQYGLRLIWLKMLGFEGFVDDEGNGWTVFKKIDEYFY